MKGLLGQLKGALAGTDKTARDAPPAAAPTASIADSIQEALAHHQAGRLPEADTIYRRILGVEPDNFDALHLSGLVRHQEGDSARAIALIGRAVAIQPTNALALGNLALVYLSCNRLGDAEASLRKALAYKPDWDDGYNRQGMLFEAQGDAAQAEASFRKCLELNPANAEATNNLANIVRERGDLAAAEELYHRTLTLRPDLAETHDNLGALYQRRGELGRAEECFRRALALRPDYAQSHNNLGSLLQLQGKLSEAEASFHKALESRGEFAEALSNLGDVLQVLGRLDEAEAYCRSALALKPDFPEALSNLSAVLKGRSDLDGAEECCRKALALDPRYVGAHVNLGTILNERGQRSEAEECYRRALELDPDNAAAQFNLSMLLLLRNDLEEGFRFYESRFKSFVRTHTGSRGLHDRLRDRPRWQGEALTGKRILVWTEQGMGDSIMMMRYLPVLKERGAKVVIVFCDPALVRLAASVQGVASVICDASDLETSFDVHCPIMSLPFLLQTRTGSVPHAVPYLLVPDDLRDRWRPRLDAARGIKVGLAWAGSRSLRDDAKRSIASHQLAPLTRVKGVQLISLQKEHEDTSLELLDWMDECDDFMDTAGLIDNLDLVVSVDTAVAHLSGALGKPTWLLNRFQSGMEMGNGPAGERLVSVDPDLLSAAGFRLAISDRCRRFRAWRGGVYLESAVRSIRRVQSRDSRLGAIARWDIRLR